MFTVTHFRSEFISQGQAMILRKVTMTQFLLVIVCTTLGVGLLKAPYWLAPLFVAIGYLAGYVYNGEILLRRAVAYAIVWLRQLAGRPQLVNLQAEWEAARTQAERETLALPTGLAIQLPRRSQSGP